VKPSRIARLLAARSRILDAARVALDRAQRACAVARRDVDAELAALDAARATSAGVTPGELELHDRWVRTLDARLAAARVALAALEREEARRQSDVVAAQRGVRQIELLTARLAAAQAQSALQQERRAGDEHAARKRTQT